MTSLKEKVALITGANKGIGYEIAAQLGAKGALVIVGARDQTLGKAAVAQLADKGVDARFILIDLSVPATAVEAASAIEREFGKLDILVNNAGCNCMGDGPPSTANMAAVREVFDTNFFGTLEVTQAMLPLLRKSSSARIVNVSSGLGSIAQNGATEGLHAKARKIGYNGSKAAMNMLTVQLAAELDGTGIKVNSVNPGFTATANNNFRGTQTVAEGAVAAIQFATIGDDGPSGGFFDSSGPEPW